MPLKKVGISFNPPHGEAGEGIQRKKFAENLRGLAREGMAGGDCRSEALANHPTFRAFPFFGVRGPAAVLGPFAFFGGIPVALVSAREFSPLAREPREILHGARHAEAGHRALAAIAVNAEARGGSIVGDADVELSARAGTGIEMREKEIHVGVVGSLVVSEANVAIDAREIFSGAASEAKSRMQFLRGGHERVEQFAKRRDNVLFVAQAVLVHPGLAVVAREFTKELECFRGEDAFLRGHGDVF